VKLGPGVNTPLKLGPGVNTPLKLGPGVNGRDEEKPEDRALVLPDSKTFSSKLLRQGDLRRQCLLPGHGVQVGKEVKKKPHSISLRVPVRLRRSVTLCDRALC
jgi:hypothetical protein